MQNRHKGALGILIGLLILFLFIFTSFILGLYTTNAYWYVLAILFVWVLGCVWFIETPDPKPTGKELKVE